MTSNNITFILHKPQLSENIGACARAMKNFNFQKLIVIKPKPIFPNDKILATSVGAKNIIKKAKIFENLEPALKNIDYVVATSARFRNKNIKHIQLEDLKKIDFSKKVAILFGSEASGLSNNEVSYANYTLQVPTNPEFKSLNLSHSLIIIAQHISSIIKSKTSNFAKSKKIAFLFGSEASGLSNNEISYANYTLQVPTNPEFKSLNLSHSLIIIAQYVANIIKSKSSSFNKSKKVKSASKKEILSMMNLCIKNLNEINFFNTKEKKPIMLDNLRNIFYRMELSSKETRILSSVFASLGKKR
jgi:tRNA/rRNA methyltransferase